MDSEALLGSLPEPWRIKQHFVQRRQRPGYFKDGIDTSYREDLRPGPLPVCWQSIDIEELDINADDPVAVDFFRNVATEYRL